MCIVLVLCIIYPFPSPNPLLEILKFPVLIYFTPPPPPLPPLPFTLPSNPTQYQIAHSKVRPLQERGWPYCRGGRTLLTCYDVTGGQGRGRIDNRVLMSGPGSPAGHQVAGGVTGAGPQWSETLYHRDDALLYIAYVMLIWAAPIPADRWHCSLWP